MFCRVGRVLPVLRSVSKTCVPRRNFLDFPRVSGLRALVRDMDRSMERLQREFFNNTPLLTQISPRMIPIHPGDSEFRVNIDVQGFNPDEVSVKVQDKVLIIKGSMERSGEDGSKYHQQFTRQITLPDNIKTGSIKSFLDQSGMLVIEAPLDVEVNEIPVKHVTSSQGGEIENK